MDCSAETLGLLGAAWGCLGVPGAAWLPGLPGLPGLSGLPGAFWLLWVAWVASGCLCNLGLGLPGAAFGGPSPIAGCWLGRCLGCLGLLLLPGLMPGARTTDFGTGRHLIGLGAYSLGAYSLGAYNLELPILELADHSLDWGPTVWASLSNVPITNPILVHAQGPGITAAPTRHSKGYTTRPIDALQWPDSPGLSNRHFPGHPPNICQKGPKWKAAKR